MNPILNSLFSTILGNALLPPSTPTPAASSLFLVSCRRGALGHQGCGSRLRDLGCCLGDGVGVVAVRWPRARPGWLELLRRRRSSSAMAATVELFALAAGSSGLGEGWAF